MAGDYSIPELAEIMSPKIQEGKALSLRAVVLGCPSHASTRARDHAIKPLLCIHRQGRFRRDQVAPWRAGNTVMPNNATGSADDATGR